MHTRIYPQAVNFREDGEGPWREIDLGLQSAGGGAVAPAAVDGELQVPSSLTAPVVLERDGSQVQVRLIGATGSRSVDDEKATFADALPGVDAVYAARPDGVKETVVLKSAAAAASAQLRYSIHADAALTGSVAGDQVTFRDAAGEAVLRIDAPLAWDSSPAKAHTNAIALGLEQTEPGKWVLTVTPDQAWLSDPARVYPVSVDPDYYWVGNQSTTRFHGADLDCMIVSDTGANNNFCASTILGSGAAYGRTYKSLLRFDVSKAIPAWATASSAIFRAYANTGNYDATLTRVRTVTSAWDSAVTWNKRNASTTWTTPSGDVSADPALVGAPAYVAEGGYWYEWAAPIAAVHGWVKGTLPNNGLQLAADAGAAKLYTYVSTEGDQASWPALDVSWNPDTTAPSGVAAASSDGGYNGDTVRGSGTVPISVSAQDDNAGLSKFELLVDGAVAATSNVSCPGNTCPKTATASLGLTTTGLAESDHLLSVRATDAAGNATIGTPWTVYVDRTPPSFDANAAASLRTINSDFSSLAWDQANDPVLPDGSGPFGVYSYTYRYQPSGGSMSAWVTTDNDASIVISGSPTSIQFEVYATDEAGNVGPTKAFSLARSADNPNDAPQPSVDDPDYPVPVPGSDESLDSLTDEGLGLGLDPLDDEATTSSARGLAAASGPIKIEDRRSYKCNGRWATIQATFSGFVSGACKGGTVVRSHYKLRCSAKRCGTKEDPAGYPGTKNEGYDWNAVQFPSSVNYKGCGWMNTAQRIVPTGNGSGPAYATCSALNHAVDDMILKYKKLANNPQPPPQQAVPKYKHLWVWSPKNGIGPRKFVPNWETAQPTNTGACQVYANINPFYEPSSPSAQYQVKPEDRTWLIRKGSQNVWIRYLAKYQVRDEAGYSDLYVNVRSSYKGNGTTDKVGDSDQAWGFVSRKCLFKKRVS